MRYEDLSAEGRRAVDLWRAEKIMWAAVPDDARTFFAGRLRSHLVQHHPRVRLTRNATELVSRHATDHHRYGCTHTHAGTNLGPGDRPPGWKTGEDVIVREEGK